MGTAIKYKKEIMNLTKELTENKLEELIDFAKFLKAKSEESPFFQNEDSAAFVRNLRMRESKRVGIGRKFIEELLEWQKSKS